MTLPSSSPARSAPPASSATATPWRSTTWSISSDRGRTNFQIGNNDNLFDFTYVGNVAHAHLLAARALLLTHDATIAPLDHEKVDGEVFFITNGSPMYFWDFSRSVWKYAGSTDGKDNVRVISKTAGLWLGWLSEVFSAVTGKTVTLNRQRIIYSCMTRYYDISKARRRLAYEPQVSLEEGIKRGVHWALEQEKAGLI